jgi:hypothetical protein
MTLFIRNVQTANSRFLYTLQIITGISPKRIPYRLKCLFPPPPNIKSVSTKRVKISFMSNTNTHSTKKKETNSMV